jgi:hypothetical protein
LNSFLKGSPLRMYIPPFMSRILSEELFVYPTTFWSRDEGVHHFCCALFHSAFGLEMSLAHRVATKYCARKDSPACSWSPETHVLFSPRWKRQIFCALLCVTKWIPSAVFQAHILPFLTPPLKSIERARYEYGHLPQVEKCWKSWMLHAHPCLNVRDPRVWKHTEVVVKRWKRERKKSRQVFNSAWIRRMDRLLLPYPWRELPLRTLIHCMDYARSHPQNVGTSEYNALVEGMCFAWGIPYTLRILYKAHAEIPRCSRELSDVLCKCEMADNAMDFGFMPRSFSHRHCEDFLQYNY